MKKYHSKIDKWILILLASSIVVSWLPLYSIWKNGSLSMIIGMTLLIGAVTWLLISILMHTYYWFDEGNIHWKTGPFKGSISINDISAVKRAESFMDVSAVIKPCLSSKPLLLRYSKYDDLPISPAEETEFISQLKQLQPSFEITV